MKKKNILLYFTDQQRADTCGCYGQELPITPVLDQLAAEGTRFDLAFTPQPVCGPCRAMFQTGAPVTFWNSPATATTALCLTRTTTALISRDTV